MCAAVEGVYGFCRAGGRERLLVRWGGREEVRRRSSRSLMCES